MTSLLGAALLASGALLVFLLRPQDGQERLVVRWPGAWIVVGLLLTFWIGSGVALMAAGMGLIQ
jgi:hypothetical protein